MGNGDYRKTQQLKALAKELGAGACGIASLQAFDDWPLEEWLDQGHQAGMAFLAKSPQKRKDPQAFAPQACCAIVLAWRTPPLSAGSIAGFGRAIDYHFALREPLEKIADWLHQQGAKICQTAIDTSAVFERGLAARAGLGWLGKSANLIHPELGTALNLAEIFTDLPLVPDQPRPNQCGHCSRCIQACPTQAICAPGVIDARRCVSYLTIEHRGPVPRALRPLIGHRLFGCDQCQLACPYNRGGSKTQGPIHPGLEDWQLGELLELSNRRFARRFRGSPLARLRRNGLARNICTVMGNRAELADTQALGQRLLSDPDLAVRVHAAWALGRHLCPQSQALLEEAQRHEAEAEVSAEIEWALAQ